METLSENVEENGEIVREIRIHCLQFYVQTVEQCMKIFRTDYIDNEFYKKLAVFESATAINDSSRDCTSNDVLFFAKLFQDFDIQELKKNWRNLHSDYSEFCDVLSRMSFDNMWKKVLAAKDTSGNRRHRELRRLINLIRSLPHSNAVAEQAFSIDPDNSTRKRNSLSVES